MQKEKIQKNKGFTPTPMNIGVSSDKAERGFTHTPKFGVTPKGGGFTLVETLVAISIFTVSIISLMTVLSNGITGTKFANNKIIAGYLAQEGIEYIRNMRDTYALSGSNFNVFESKLALCNQEGICGFNDTLPIIDNNFISKCNNDCKLYINNGSYTSVSGEESGFTRTVWMDNINSGEEVKIYSKVKWMQGSGEYDVTLSENLFNWIE